MGWRKEANVATLTPAATIVALERDLLLSSLSRALGSEPPVAGPHAVPDKAGARVRAAAEVVALVRRGEFIAALGCAGARRVLDDPGSRDDDGCDAAAEGIAPEAAAAARYERLAASLAAASAAAVLDGGVEPAAHDLNVLAVGVAALGAFTQCNVTGPVIEDAPRIPGTAAKKEGDAGAVEAWDRWAKTQLSLDGEDLNGRCLLPQYLYLARVLLVEPHADRAARLAGDDVATATLAAARAAAPKPVARSGRVVLWPEAEGPPATRTPPSATWWASRVALVHQRLLSGRAPTLRRVVLGLHALTLGVYAPDNVYAAAGGGQSKAGETGEDGAPTRAAAAAANERLLASMALLEASLMEHEYGHVDSAQALLKFSGDAIGCTHEVTGQMGFRTVHQTSAKAQMVLDVRCDGLPMFKRQRASGAADDDAASDDEADEIIAEETAAAAAAAAAKEGGAATTSAAMARIATELKGLSVDGSQILTKPRLVHPEGEPGATTTTSEDAPGLPAAVQCILLAAAVTVRKSQADDGMRSWSVAPYHEAVQAQRRSRPVLRAAAAVLSSRHERTRPRTRERALLYMEDLVRGLEAPSPSAAARARYVHSVWFPPNAMLKKELGDQLVALGMVGAALELFEEIELWDSLIVCLTLLGKKQAAADTIRRRLEENPDEPKLWCALGDALDDEAHFKKALEVSGGKSARAMRSLARRAVAREDWACAAEHWTNAMAINPLFPDGWFSCGYACLKAGREEEALRAFVRATQLDDQNGQAWNNVAALNIRKGSYAAAHVALQEATKQAHDSWQTWENLAMVAAKVGRFQQSARALMRVMELTGGAKLHVATLSTLVERCKEARAGSASWLGKEEEAEKAEAAAAAKYKAELGRIAQTGEEEEEEEEEESWEGVRAPGQDDDTGGDIGDAAADLLGAFFSDDDDDDDDVAPAAADDDIASQVQSREVARLEASVEDVLKRALGGGSTGERTIKETADLWSLSADLHEAKGDHLVAAEARLKRVRALDTSGWRKDAAAFAEFAVASLDMARGHVRAAAAAATAGEEKSVEEARRALSQSRMHMRGLIKTAEAQQFDEEMGDVYAELVKCAEEVAGAEETMAAKRDE